MWRDILTPWMADLDIGAPASEEEIQAAEGLTGPLPESLRELLREFNGLNDEYGTEIIWTTQRIQNDNAYFRTNREFMTLYAPFDSLLFFGDNGGGDQFAFSPSNAVVAWDHETDDRETVAGSLRAYLVNCLESQGSDWHKE